MSRIIFISWEKHQRTRSLCEKLNIPLFELHTSRSGISRYLELIPRTIKIIRERNPDVLFVQNPSILLSGLAVSLKYFFKYTLIVDAHNEAVEPFIHNNFIVRLLSKCIIALTNRTLVTNNMLADKVNLLGGRSLVLPDFLPNMEPRNYLALSSDKPCEVTLISTYADDEPYDEVFKSVSALGSKVLLNVTGKIPEKLKSAKLSPNIKLLGFLSEHDYWETLFKSHIIIDLTTMKDCLVCGAYEALAIEKPVLLSANKASESLFGSYAYHVENSATDIQRGLIYLIENYVTLKEPIHEARLEFLRLEKSRIKDFTQTLY